MCLCPEEARQPEQQCLRGSLQKAEHPGVQHAMISRGSLCWHRRVCLPEPQRLQQCLWPGPQSFLQSGVWQCAISTFIGPAKATAGSFITSGTNLTFELGGGAQHKTVNHAAMHACICHLHDRRGTQTTAVPHGCFAANASVPS